MNTSLSELTRPKANILPARFQASLVKDSREALWMKKSYGTYQGNLDGKILFFTP